MRSLLPYPAHLRSRLSRRLSHPDVTFHPFLAPWAPGRLLRPPVNPPSPPFDKFRLSFPIVLFHIPRSRPLPISPFFLQPPSSYHRRTIRTEIHRSTASRSFLSSKKQQQHRSTDSVARYINKTSDVPHFFALDSGQCANAGLLRALKGAWGPTTPRLLRTDRRALAAPRPLNAAAAWR